MEIRIQFGSFFLFPRTQKDFSAKIFAGQIPREIGSSDRPSFFSVKKRRRDKNFDKFSFSIFEEKKILIRFWTKKWNCELFLLTMSIYICGVVKSTGLKY